MDRAREQFEAAGVSIVLIGQLSSHHAAHFRRRQQIELPVLADGQRQSYREAGAKVATLNELLGPRVLAKGIATSRRTGQLQGRTIGHPAQLGGVLLIDTDGTVLWSHLAEDAGDNASPEEILQAARSTLAQGGPQRTDA